MKGEEQKLEEPKLLPVFDGVTATCARFGFSRTYFRKEVRPKVEVRSLAKKLLIRQFGPRSVLEYVESLPGNMKGEHGENLARGTTLSHKRKLRRERRKRERRAR